MKKKLTLDQTWKYCLQMWKWIAKQIKQGTDLDSYDLKRNWLKNYPQFGEIENHCFFCEYVGVGDDNHTICSQCPGRLVNKRFDCQCRTYHWFDKPLKFYQKLLEFYQKFLKLNEKRKKK